VRGFSSRKEKLGDSLQQKPAVPLVDLDTIRETLAYIRDDIRRVPGLERAADRLTSALTEIAAAERRRLGPISHSVIDARLVLRRKH
jgi:hypothetical protein